MKIYKSISLLFLSLLWLIANAQVSLDHYAITGVTIIDANHKTPLCIKRFNYRNISPIFSQMVVSQFPLYFPPANGWKIFVAWFDDAHVH